MVLINDHRCLVPAVGLRDRQLGAGRHIDNGCAVEGVAVHPDDGLLVDRDRLPGMVPQTKAPAQRQQGVEIRVGLRPGET